MRQPIRDWEHRQRILDLIARVDAKIAEENQKMSEALKRTPMKIHRYSIDAQNHGDRPRSPTVPRRWRQVVRRSRRST